MLRESIPTPKPQPKPQNDFLAKGTLIFANLTGKWRKIPARSAFLSEPFRASKNCLTKGTLFKYCITISTTQFVELLARLGATMEALCLCSEINVVYTRNYVPRAWRPQGTDFLVEATFISQYINCVLLHEFFQWGNIYYYSIGTAEVNIYWPIAL